MSFSSIPVLDLALAQDPATVGQFREQLRYALIDVGFLLLKNYETIGPSRAEFEQIKQQSAEFFALPQHVKDGCSMIHSKHFLGYTRLANEITSAHTDWREQIDLGTELPAPGPDEPIYRNIEGPNLWPDEHYIPAFRPTITGYITKMTDLARELRFLICEALGLDAHAMDGYFKPQQQAKMKLIAYPDSSQLQHEKSQVLSDDPSTGQGCGPHRDSDLITFIYQATDHTESLQVQNFAGDWISVPNVPHTLVVNAGQTLEAITRGVCKATIHRVMVPRAGSGTRISVPFFQTIDLDAHKTVLEIPSEIMRLKDERDKRLEKWAQDTGFQFVPDVDRHPVGHYVFRNRIKSHQDVAARWYPEILKEVLSAYQ